jgi:hypothetical protein
LNSRIEIKHLTGDGMQSWLICGSWVLIYYASVQPLDNTMQHPPDGDTLFLWGSSRRKLGWKSLYRRRAIRASVSVDKFPEETNQIDLSTENKVRWRISEPGVILTSF